MTFASKDAKTELRVLAIDDNSSVLERIEGVLVPAGYRVLTATDGLQGLDIARVERPDLAVIDLVMPDTDGLAVVERLRADPSTVSIPTVVLLPSSIDQAEFDLLNSRIGQLARERAFNRMEFVELVRKLCLHGGDSVRKGDKRDW
jgi:CheY-like chemotaxis protein